ncbi:hypothetical protein SmJEL517_g03193 [Synchytrium microbalum]|uniref:C2H2-type domain-containing protein n=1 Tax=Synchytrium microbalum TaxID=1806994 RepID=A0A507BXD1_9FUNG|nr:uncharacterized protein SmJEL517_g03193 [Synchytrium microbalum]TPX33980.1 hypothetical protein SmJEL517_g03193 [Synchytrium microbalum]
MAQTLLSPSTNLPSALLLPSPTSSLFDRNLSALYEAFTRPSSAYPHGPLSASIQQQHGIPTSSNTSSSSHINGAGENLDPAKDPRTATDNLFSPAVKGLNVDPETRDSLASFFFSSSSPNHSSSHNDNTNNTGNGSNNSTASSIQPSVLHEPTPVHNSYSSNPITTTKTPPFVPPITTNFNHHQEHHVYPNNVTATSNELMTPYRDPTLDYIMGSFLDGMESLQSPGGTFPTFGMPGMTPKSAKPVQYSDTMLLLDLDGGEGPDAGVDEKIIKQEPVDSTITTTHPLMHRHPHQHHHMQPGGNFQYPTYPTPLLIDNRMHATQSPATSSNGTPLLHWPTPTSVTPMYITTTSAALKKQQQQQPSYMYSSPYPTQPTHHGVIHHPHHHMRYAPYPASYGSLGISMGIPPNTVNMSANMNNMPNGGGNNAPPVNVLHQQQMNSNNNNSSVSNGNGTISSSSSIGGMAMAAPGGHQQSNKGGRGTPTAVGPGGGNGGVGGSANPAAAASIMSASNSTPGGRAKPFKCDKCPQTFSRSHDLKRHMYIHTQQKPYTCARCQKGFSRRDALRRHEKSVAEGKKVHCVPRPPGQPGPDGDEDYDEEMEQDEE